MSVPGGGKEDEGGERGGVGVGLAGGEEEEVGVVWAEEGLDDRRRWGKEDRDVGWS
jgi:hypothetical protein